MGPSELLAGVQALRILAETMREFQTRPATPEEKAAAWDRVISEIERAEANWEDSKKKEAD